MSGAMREGGLRGGGGEGGGGEGGVGEGGDGEGGVGEGGDDDGSEGGMAVASCELGAKLGNFSTASPMPAAPSFRTSASAVHHHEILFGFVALFGVQCRPPLLAPRHVAGPRTASLRGNVCRCLRSAAARASGDESTACRQHDARDTKAGGQGRV